LIGNNKLFAKTNTQFPIGTNLNLLVIDVSEEKIILTLNKDNWSENSLSQLLENLNLKNTDENIKLISRLMKNNLKLSPENIKLAQHLLDLLPLERTTAIELITDPTLFAAIFNSSPETNSGFTLTMQKSKQKENEKTIYDINILYQSGELGDILVNIHWTDLLTINFFCSNKKTVLLLENHISEFRKKLIYISQLEININFEEKLIEKMNNEDTDTEKIYFKGIDICI